MTSREAIARGDEALIAQLGYRHEFKRAFNPLEVRLLRLSSQSTPARRCSGSPSALLASSRPLRMSHPFYHRITVSKRVQLCSGLYPSEWWRVFYGVGGMYCIVVPFGEWRC